MEARDVAYLVGLVERRLGRAVRAHSWPWLRDDDGGFLVVDAFWPGAAAALVVPDGPADPWRHAPAELALRGIRLVVLPEDDLPTTDGVGRARDLDGTADEGAGDTSDPTGDDGAPAGGAALGEGAPAEGAAGVPADGPPAEGADGTDDLDDVDEGPYDEERHAVPGDRLAREDRLLLALLAERGLLDDRAVAAATERLAPYRDEDENEDEDYDENEAEDADAPATGSPELDARALTRTPRPSGGDIWDDARPDVVPSDPDEWTPLEDLDWPSPDAGAPPGWRSGPILLAALASAVLARRCFAPSVLGGLEPEELQVLAAIRTSADLGPGARTDTPAGLARALGLRESDVRTAVTRLAAIGLLWEVQWMDDRLLVTRPGRDALDAWLGRIADGFRAWPPSGPEADDAD